MRDFTKNNLIYFFAERNISLLNIPENVEAFELLKESEDMLNMYVAWMFANLIVLQKSDNQD